MPASSDWQHVWLRSRPILLGLLLLLPLLYGLSGLYSVSNEQRGVRYRFGALVDESVPPGMHYHLPFPIERVELRPAATVQSLEVSFTELGVEMQPKELATGDNNLLAVVLVVQYSTQDLGQFLHHVQRPVEVLENLIQANATRLMARANTDNLLTTGRHQFQQALLRNTQQHLDRLESGIRLSAVQLKALTPPASVKSAFDRVDRARTEKRKLISDARSAQNSARAKARAEARKVRLTAQASAEEIVSAAQGEAARYAALLKEYQQAPQAMGHKLYTDALGRILPNIQWSAASTPNKRH